MHPILKSIYIAIVQSQAWVALCFTLLCFYFQTINNIYNSNLLWISFFATLFAYNLAYWFANKSILWRIPIIILSALLCVYIGVTALSYTSLICLGLLGLISVLYTLPINTYSLRRVPGLKIFWIAIVWSFTLFIPWIESNSIEWWPMLWQSICIMFFVIGITIPFDIRDMKLDINSLHTIPQLIGIERSIRLATQLLVLSAGMFLISIEFKINNISIAYLITILISIALVRRSSYKQNKWFTSFWIEGMSMLPFIIYHLIP